MIREVRKIAHQILDLAGTLPVQIFIRVKKGMLVRFTNNGVHQNGFQDIFFYMLRLRGKEGSVFLESNDVSKAGIETALRRIGTLVPHAIPLPAVRKMGYPKVREDFPLLLSKIPEMAARAIEEGLSLIRREQASANGYYSAYKRFFYLADSRGFEVYHPASAVRFGATITKGAGKGYFSSYHPNPRMLSVPSVVRQAIAWANQSALREVSLAPGAYECVLSPRAFLELIEPLRHHFDGHLYRTGKSVLAGLLGRRVFSEAFTLYDDVCHPGQFGVPFDQEGMPKPKVLLVSRGILKGLLRQGHSTWGIGEHPFYPENLVVEKGSVSLAGIFKRIQKGIFINKIRYHALVRETGMEVTGLATAGTLYIEKGRALGRLAHLRYHDSLFSILSSVVGRTKEQVLLKDGERGAALFPYFWISKLHVV